MNFTARPTKAPETTYDQFMITVVMIIKQGLRTYAIKRPFVGIVRKTDAAKSFTAQRHFET